MSEEPRKAYFSWADLSYAVRNIKAQIQQADWWPQEITAIGSGGLIPAAMLARELYKDTGQVVHMSSPIYCQSYEGTKQGDEVSLTMPRSLAMSHLPDEQRLFVDDIVDSGKTMERVLGHFKGGVFASVVTKIDCPGYHGRKMIGDKRWIVFPWE